MSTALLCRWADAGWHRIDDKDPSQDVVTPVMNQLVKEGIEMDRQYVCESPNSPETDRRDSAQHSVGVAAQTSTARRLELRSSLAATPTT